MMSGFVQEHVLRHKPMTSEQEVRRTKTSEEDVFKVFVKNQIICVIRGHINFCDYFARLGEKNCAYFLSGLKENSIFVA